MFHKKCRELHKSCFDWAKGLEEERNQLRKENKLLKITNESLTHYFYTRNCPINEIPSLLDERDSLKQENERLKAEVKEMSEAGKFWIEKWRTLYDEYSHCEFEIKQLKAQLEQHKSRMAARYCDKCGKNPPSSVFLQQLCDSCKPEHCEVSGVKLDSNPERKPSSDIMAEAMNDYLQEKVKSTENLTESMLEYCKKKYGYGNTERKPHKCPVCDGFGKIELVNINTSCGSCKGAGVVWENEQSK